MRVSANREASESGRNRLQALGKTVITVIKLLKTNNVIYGANVA